MILQAAIERATSRRPDLADLSGDQILDVLMARVAHDASQTLAPDPCGYGPAASGAREDAESTKTLRWLLKLMRGTR